jgi:hypothetical protein
MIVEGKEAGGKQIGPYARLLIFAGEVNYARRGLGAENTFYQPLNPKSARLSTAPSAVGLLAGIFVVAAGSCGWRKRHISPKARFSLERVRSARRRE